MNNEHLALVVDLLDLRPAEVIRFARALKREDPAVVDAEVQRRALVILQQDEANGTMSWCSIWKLYDGSRIFIIIVSIIFFLRIQIFS